MTTVLQVNDPTVGRFRCSPGAAGPEREPLGASRFARRASFLAVLLFPAFPCVAAEPDLRRDATVVATEKVMPCVVNIATETVVEYEDFYQRIFRDFFGQTPYGGRRQQKEYSIGSGVIIDEDGYILTNLHVVRRAKRTQIKLWNGNEYEADRIVATTHSDVALLKIRKKQPNEKFTAIKLAADDDVLLGETVIALGNPFGLGGSVTKGIISSKSRRAAGNEPLDVNNWLQTDAAINPGNSGGPLINLRGELVGLNVAVYREGQGIGFAIPATQVSEALASFFSPEISHSIWFGARLKSGPPPLEIAAVQAGGPAEKAGLRKGDKVLQVNGQPADGLIQFNRKLCASPESNARLQVQHAAETGRSGSTVEVKMIPFVDLLRRQVGLNLTELSPEQASSSGLQTEALRITEVEKGSPAERARLVSGFLLAGIDGKSTPDLMTAGAIMTGKSRGDHASLTILIPQRLRNGLVQYREARVDLETR
jgi:S1-C subfamily serine protease